MDISSAAGINAMAAVIIMPVVKAIAICKKLGPCL